MGREEAKQHVVKAAESFISESPSIRENLVLPRLLACTLNFPSLPFAAVSQGSLRAVEVLLQHNNAQNKFVFIF